jgi:NAD-dependent SIR2 family protein deacetylase
VNDLWKHYPTFKSNTIYRATLLTHEFCQSQPSKFWYFFGREYNLYKTTPPSPAYFQLLQIAEALKRNSYFMLTTNYDDHALKEGFPEEKVFEAHGNITYLQ